VGRSLGPGEIVEIIELPGNDRCFECAHASVATSHSTRGSKATCPCCLSLAPAA
jgi:hypothetical protein